MWKALTICTVTAALAACSPPPALDMENAWVRLAAVPGRPAAGYFTVRGGATDATLIAVSADRAIRAEMHETARTANGRGMTMRAIDAVPVPAEGAVAFAPGGRHAMLLDVDPQIARGGSIALTLTFADGSRVTRPARVLAAADPAPEDR